MQVLKKISSFVFLRQKQTTLILNKNRSFVPVTRLQKVVAAQNNYPSSTGSKLVFIARKDGIGFQEETYPTCPEHIPLDEMVQEINVVCQKQWELNRQHQKKHPFQRSNQLINYFSIAVEVLIMLMSVLWWGMETDQFFDVAWVIMVPVALLVAVNFVLALAGYFTPREEPDYDALMVSMIRRKLAQLNDDEAARQQRPDYEWSCHRDCLWIAIKINVQVEIF